MSEQTVSKSVHTIPQRIIEEIENSFSRPSSMNFEHPVFQKVDEVEFIRTFKNKDGIWEEFKVNSIILVSVLDAENWTWITVEEDEKRKKAFGKRVKYVMQEANVPWDLAKIAVSRNPVDSWHSESTANIRAICFIKAVKEALDCYLNFYKERMSMEEYLEKSGYSYLGHLTNKQIQIIKEYWLSLNT